MSNMGYGAVFRQLEGGEGGEQMLSKWVRFVTICFRAYAVCVPVRAIGRATAPLFLSLTNRPKSRCCCQGHLLLQRCRGFPVVFGKHPTKSVCDTERDCLVAGSPFAMNWLLRLLLRFKRALASGFSMGLLIVFGPSWRGGCVAGSSPNDGSLGVCLKNSIICMQMQHKFTEGIWLDESSVRSLTYICWCLKPFERQKPMALGVALLQKG